VNNHKATECDCAECVAYRTYFYSIGWDMQKMDYYRRPGLPAQEETSPALVDDSKKHYRLVRTYGQWQLWFSDRSREQRWLTDREVAGLNGKTFAENWYDSDQKFKPGGA
jgi:hypothetical protein